MDITSKMINCLDLLSIDIYDIDRVSPAVIDIKSALNNYPNLPEGNECTEKIGKWVNILKTKQASDLLAPDEIRSLKMDLETSYRVFGAIIEKQ